MSDIASFRQKLAVLGKYLDDPAVTEIAINRPGEVWIGRQGERYMQPVQLCTLNYALLSSLAEVTAHYSAQHHDRRKPLLSATIPIDLRDGIPVHQRGGYRVQIILPPAVEERTVAVTIRKPALLDFSFDDYTQQGAFNDVNRVMTADVQSDQHLRQLFNERRWRDFLSAAIKAHKNIVISAGTNAGKTTILNAMLKEIPKQERIVTIEDSREVRPPQPNRLHLLYSRGGQGEADVGAVELLETVLRLTPDRAIIGELRGAEAYAYLELLNTGHSGSITTVHANSPTLMFERLAQMVMRFGSPLTKAEIIDYARSLIDVVVQFQRDAKGRRYISQIDYAGVRHV
ncbi:P-type DNA transfer ATPase VirB11 [Budviciaceae bacterium CWB-B4]|uniref:Type IV secretion system protein n=1 Tax=Limnobaculum xujianqingii TaxID=2738837 RepID=A0A9D7AF65_9GAMM|nr:P-type DNA transfer ATPase VirB11 [Limnobaculum xujianqingii]MBK5071617.1 P-type DNA transfer ATPase VirB11 [Limnobaculum xujianqingii]MBK5174926.1 P-type DNA transfer ATPase VirB11 [Limnobaculum xujianqingii]